MPLRYSFAVDVPNTGSGWLYYDDPVVFDRYTRHHDSGISSPNHVMEKPAVLVEIGDPIGLRVLDLGCGDASLGRDPAWGRCRQLRRHPMVRRI